MEQEEDLAQRNWDQHSQPILPAELTLITADDRAELGLGGALPRLEPAFASTNRAAMSSICC